MINGMEELERLLDDLTHLAGASGARDFERDKARLACIAHVRALYDRVERLERQLDWADRLVGLPEMGGSNPPGDQHPR